MAIDAEVYVDWSGPDVNPYADPRFTYSGDFMIAAGGLKDANAVGGRKYLAFNDQVVDPSKTLRASVTSAVVGPLWSDPFGAALADFANGNVYYANLNGTQGRAYKVTAAGAPEQLNVAWVHSQNATDVYSISLTPAGLLSFEVNDTVMDTVVDTDFAIGTLQPGATSSREDQNANGMSGWGADGFVSGAVAPSWNDTPAPPAAVVGDPYEYDFSSMVDGDEPITISSIGTALPFGLGISGKTIVGTPAIEETTTGLQFRASGVSPPADSGTFSLVVAAADIPPSWTATPTPHVGAVGVPYTYDMTSIIRGEEPIVLSNIGATLPDGLSIAGKTITGTPTASATTTGLELRATGIAPPADSGVFSMVISDAGTAITSVSLSQGGLATGVDFTQASEILYCDAVDLIAEGFEPGPATIEVLSATDSDTHPVTLEFIPPAEDPILTNPQSSNITDTSALVTVDTNAALGIVYVLASTSPIEPTPEHVAANGFGAPVTQVGEQGPFVLGGLTPFTQYYYWFTQYIGGGTYANVVGG
jgi:hypothetical protein